MEQETCTVYTLTPICPSVEYGIRTYPPPYCQPIDSLPESFNQEIIPLTGIEWTNARVDKDALMKNVHVWELITKSLVKRHPTEKFPEVALVAQLTMIQEILESRRVFFERAKFTDENGKRIQKMKHKMKRLCQVYVPILRRSENDRGRIQQWFCRWSII